MVQGQDTGNGVDRREPTGKNQQALLGSLRREYREHQTANYSSDDLRRLLKELQVHRKRHKETINGLTEGGFLQELAEHQFIYVPTDGPLTQSGMQGQAGTGKQLWEL